eukprot:TRINITY_DN27049_c0_g1_i1.p2 TRINITY_DN27049_c0_g1~~TRINITY_DN27049_c0_g1_i1.p2  ORF type:complete len:433 (+),score=110.40 TRINITY_DN27049_c0_g1_i1:41-1300(+)
MCRYKYSDCIAVCGIAILFLVGGSDAADVPLNLSIVPGDIVAEFGAACLDGTPPAYYIRPGTPSNTRWALFLEGGGWCWSIDDCYQRSLGGGGSSRFYGPQFEAGGVLSADPAVNPDFYQFTAVFIKYCDGSSFSGFGSAPVPVPGHNAALHFRGRANLDAVITDLLRNQGMNASKEIILSGGSAGALATYINVDHVATLLPPTARFVGFPDAGFFLDHANVEGQFAYRSQLQGIDPVWNTTAARTTDVDCLAAQSPGEAWKCLMAPYLVAFIKTPLFIMNALYDIWQLPNILGLDCWPPNCNADQAKLYQQYRLDFLAAFEGFTNDTRHGYYLDSCFVHEQNVDYCSTQSLPNCRGWNVYRVNATDGTSLTPQQSFGDWYYGRGAGDLGRVVDASLFPQNPSCPFSGPSHPTVYPEGW